MDNNDCKVLNILSSNIRFINVCIPYIIESEDSDSLQRILDLSEQTQQLLGKNTNFYSTIKKYFWKLLL